MKDHLQDIISHTSALGFIDLVKITGTDKETKINAIAEDRNVILEAKFKNPHSDFIGLFGMPNLSKLRTILGFQDYAENAKISMTRETRNGETIPTSIHFETATADFINDYRLMSQALVEERVKPVKFAGATWNVSFEPTKDNIQRLKRQASANSEEILFTTKTDNGNIRVYFGDVSTHSGNFIFAPSVAGTLNRAWSWPVKQFLGIMDLIGDKRVHISDQGAMQITVDSGLIDYVYLLPAQQR